MIVKLNNHLFIINKYKQILFLYLISDFFLINQYFYNIFDVQAVVQRNKYTKLKSINIIYTNLFIRVYFIYDPQ